MCSESNNLGLAIGRLFDKEDNFISFVGSNGNEMLKLQNNGDIYVHGKLIENDKEVVDGIRDFLASHKLN